MSAAAAAPEAGEAAPKKGKKKLIIIIAAVLLLAGGGGGFFYMKSKAAAEAAAEEDGGESAHVEKKPKKEKKEKKDDHAAPPVFVPLDPFVVNLADREVDRFAQIGVTLQVEDAKVGDQIKAYLPAIRNNILLLLSRKTAQDLAGAEGKELLAEEILRVAVQPMGVELAPLDEEEAPKGKKKKRYDSIDDSPIKHIQFSSFIIQ